MYNEIINILSAETFRKLASGDIIQIAEINAITSLLLKANIPFDMLFSPGNKRFAKQVRLIIYITPATTLSFNLQFEAGATAL